MIIELEKELLFKAFKESDYPMGIYSEEGNAILVNNKFIFYEENYQLRFDSIISEIKGKFRDKKTYKQTFIKPLFEKGMDAIYIVTKLLSSENKSYYLVSIGNYNEIEKTFSKGFNLDSRRDKISESIISNQIVAQSNMMVSIIKLAKKIAIADCTVLIVGETGVGKELIADLIHFSSLRRNKPFVKINCSSIPDQLLESELFGYVQGAFTGAAREGKTGLIESANGGSVLLDEISEIPQSLQTKLLRFLQSKEVFKLGAKKPTRLDVRIIAATNRNIDELVKEGKFREDLFYRLNVVPIKIPPLRRRPEDIAPLLEHFLLKCNNHYHLKKRMSKEVIHILKNYSWPGNVRELENLVERLVITTEGDEIRAEDLPTKILSEADWSKSEVLESSSLKAAKEELEKILIQKTLDEYKSIRKAAKVLGVDHATVIRKMRQYKIVF